MPTNEIQLRPGDSVTITNPVPVILFRWPVYSFRVACDTPQPLYRDPDLKIPATTITGQPRMTPATPMDVYAIYTGERALMVFPYPALWIDGDHAHVVS